MLHFRTLCCGHLLAPVLLSQHAAACVWAISLGGRAAAKQLLSTASRPPATPAQTCCFCHVPFMAALPLICSQVTASCVQGPRELGSRACKADMAEGAPRHWRQRYEATGEGAFVGLQVMVPAIAQCCAGLVKGPHLPHRVMQSRLLTARWPAGHSMVAPQAPVCDATELSCAAAVCLVWQVRRARSRSSVSIATGKSLLLPCSAVALALLLPWLCVCQP